MATTTTNLGLTKPSVNDAADIAVLNANFDKIDEKCNPALFSPSGYGLGLTGSHLTALTDANEAQRNGWYLINKNTANGVGQMAIVRVDCEAWAHCVQTAYSASYSSSTPMIMRRVKNSGTWKDWEWVNPPMTLGVEYRTTERWQGKPVYAKLIDFGVLPNTAHKVISTGFTEGVKIISYDGLTSFGQPIPFNGSDIDPTNIGRVELYVNPTNIWIYASRNMGGMTAQVRIKYTKD